jgi:hypothetical protein
LADTSVFLGVASILAVFDISKAKDDNGNTIEPPLGQTNGTIRCVAIYQPSVATGG